MRELWKRLRADRVALVSGVVLLILVLAALFGPLLVPYGAQEMAGPPLSGPTWSFWLGTDELGRDILTRTLHGARTSLAFGLVSTAIAMAIGVPWGLFSGYLGGWFDLVSARLVDAMLAFPSIVAAMAIVAAMGSSPLTVMIAVGITQIPRFCRLVRAEVLGLRSREYVQAARSFGAGGGFVLRQSILPNLTSLIAVQATLTFALAVLTEASLSYLGLGVQPPTPSWGAMLETSRSFLVQNPGYSIFVGGAIFLTLLSLSLLGDGLSASERRPARRRKAVR